MGSYCDLYLQEAMQVDKYGCIPCCCFMHNLAAYFVDMEVFISFMLQVQLGNSMIIKIQSSCNKVCPDRSQCSVKYG